MKYYKIIIRLSWLLTATCSFAQPRIVGTLAYGGPQNGGSIFRADLPAAPATIYSFYNLAPHLPSAGLCAGDNDWLYGMLTFNGTDNSGGLYKIRKDGTGFKMLYNLTGNSNVIPYYHTDGCIYFTDVFEIKKYNPIDSTVTDVGSGGYPRNLLIDSNNWIYSTNGYSITKIKTDGTGWAELYSFVNPLDGLGGLAGLTEVGDSLFGVQPYGGNSNEGTLFRIKKDGSAFTVLHHFADTSGSYPESRLAYFDGKLFGTTTQGGDNGFGVLYTVNPDGTGYRVLHHFDPGTYFTGSIVGNISIAANGRVFGSFAQFYYSAGVPYRLFKIDTSGENFEPFVNAITYDQHEYGHFNEDILLTDNDETIFLATQEMGKYDGGALSQFDTTGSGFSLYEFGYAPNGFRPMGGLIKGSTGELFGTASIGGIDGAGVIYSVDTNGNGYTKLHEFTDAEGYQPSGKLLEASDGKLYGACMLSASFKGCIYRINKNGTGFEIIYSFMDLSGGYSPAGSLIEDGNGFLYGTTLYSSPGSGVVFRMNKDGSNYTVLKVLNTSTAIGYPYAGLSISGDYLYGACGYGGTENKGGVFRIKKDGSGYQELRIFQGSTDGSSPRSVPLIASNGKLYGTTDFGGANNEGTLFRMDTSGANYAILKDFSSATDGATPEGGLIQASDGLLYGSTSFSAISGVFGGTLYKMNLDGSGFSVVHAFDFDSEGEWVSSLLDLKGSFALPVELLSFNGEKTGQAALLTWKTAQEQNSDHFDIERSSNGALFDRIGRVTAAGNTNSITVYSFTDSDPLPGVNYYRLKQVDIDGAFTYTKVIAVNFGGQEKLVVFPNPVSDRLFIRLPQGSNYQAVRVLDASGRLVLQQNITAQVIAELPVQNLSKGWYLIQLVGGTQLEKIFLKE